MNYLTLEAFKEMDHKAIEYYHLPIELMMENAGLQLAQLIVRNCKPSDTILIGVGNGNNGGGGLVAARRLAAWGYNVHLDLPITIDKELPKKQLERANLFGARDNLHENPTIWVDAYLGFSQRLPLSGPILSSIRKANESDAIRISLDLPTGIDPANYNNPDMFKADIILTMAAPKQILKPYETSASIFLADLGIPKALYEELGIEMPLFTDNSPVQIA